MPSVLWSSRFSSLPEELVDFNNKLVIYAFIFSLALFAVSKKYLNDADKTYLASLNPLRLFFHSVLYALPPQTHSISVTLMAAYVVVYEPLQADQCRDTSVTATVACAVTIGYMFADFVNMLFHWKDQGECGFVLHHALTAGAYTYVAYKGIFHHLAMMRLLAEFSTPFVATRYSLSVLGLSDTKTYLYNGCAMLAAFTVARIATIPYFIYILFTLPKTESFKSVGMDGEIIFYASFAVLDGLNIYWYYLMIAGGIKLLRKKRAKSLSTE